MQVPRLFCTLKQTSVKGEDLMQDRDEVEAMLRAGKPFGQIEDRIEAMHVSGEAKSALWLLAWSEREAGKRHHVREEPPSAALPAG